MAQPPLGWAVPSLPLGEAWRLATQLGREVTPGLTPEPAPSHSATAAAVSQASRGLGEPSAKPRSWHGDLPDPPSGHIWATHHVLHGGPFPEDDGICEVWPLCKGRDCRWGDREATTATAPSCSVVAFHQGTEALPAPSLGRTFPSPSGTPSLRILVRCSATLTLAKEINKNPRPGLRRPVTPSAMRALSPATGSTWTALARRDSCWRPVRGNGSSSLADKVKATQTARTQLQGHRV